MGTVSLHLVSLWYPAGEAAGRPAPYMTDEEAAAMLKGQKVTDVPSKAVSGIRTHSVTGARPPARPAGTGRCRWWCSRPGSR
ncbi:hypothetical protein AB0C33_14050 [Nonomuraea sp. NPDC048881]|uniref:hypothetical protein n=1 Tax=Nonomuraea sp. NPDC048881 TaxID=3155030 RepID=UPI0034092BB9